LKTELDKKKLRAIHSVNANKMKRLSYSERSRNDVKLCEFLAAFLDGLLIVCAVFLLAPIFNVVIFGSWRDLKIEDICGQVISSVVMLARAIASGFLSSKHVRKGASESE
jgi:hypothetical protein